MRGRARKTASKVPVRQIFDVLEGAKDMPASAKSREASRARMKKLWADPDFRAMMAERSRARMKAQMQDPDFRAAHAAGGVKRRKPKAAASRLT